MIAGTPTRTQVSYGGEVITYRELPRQEIGVSFNDPTSRKEWLFDGSFNKNSILAVAGASIPVLDICGGVSRFFERYDCKEQGGGAWVITAQYRSKPAYWELSIRTTGGTAKMLQSYRTVRGYDCTGRIANENPAIWKTYNVARNFNRAIGVNGNNVEGVEVVVPTLDYTVNYKFQLSSLSASYLQTLFYLTGSANDAAYTLAWQGQSITFAKGDLRFLGSQVKQTSDNQLDITFNFAASKGAAGGTLTVSDYVQPDFSTPPFVINSVVIDVDSTVLFSVGQRIYIVGERNGERLEGGEYTVLAVNSGASQLTVERVTGTAGEPLSTLMPAGMMVSADYLDKYPLAIGSSAPIKKEGWEYLWVCYEETPEIAGGRIVKKPVSAYVEQVIRYGNFATIGII